MRSWPDRISRFTSPYPGQRTGAQFLCPTGAMRSLLAQQGSTELSFDDKSAKAQNWFRERLAAMGDTAAARLASVARQEFQTGIPECLEKSRRKSGGGYRGGVWRGIASVNRSSGERRVRPPFAAFVDRRNEGPQFTSAAFLLINRR